MQWKNIKRAVVGLIGTACLSVAQADKHYSFFANLTDGASNFYQCYNVGNLEEAWEVTSLRTAWDNDLMTGPMNMVSVTFGPGNHIGATNTAGFPGNGNILKKWHYDSGLVTVSNENGGGACLVRASFHGDGREARAWCVQCGFKAGGGQCSCDLMHPY